MIEITNFERVTPSIHTDGAVSGATTSRTYIQRACDKTAGWIEHPLTDSDTDDQGDETE